MSYPNRKEVNLCNYCMKAKTYRVINLLVSIFATLSTTTLLIAALELCPNDELSSLNPFLLSIGILEVL
jgi:hypothetical protein